MEVELRARILGKCCPNMCFKTPKYGATTPSRSPWPGPTRVVLRVVSVKNRKKSEKSEFFTLLRSAWTGSQRPIFWGFVGPIATPKPQSMGLQLAPIRPGQVQQGSVLSPKKRNSEKRGLDERGGVRGPSFGVMLGKYQRSLM